MNNPKFEGPLPEEIRNRYTSNPVVTPPRIPKWTPVAPSLPAAPPQSRSPFSFSNLFLILGVIFFLIVALFNLSKSSSPVSSPVSSPSPSSVSPQTPRSSPAPVVLRAEPAVPRAELVIPRALPVVGVGYPMRMPSGEIVNAVFRGYLNDVSDLPRTGGLEGDWYTVGAHDWILTHVFGTAKVGWIDP